MVDCPWFVGIKAALPPSYLRHPIRSPFSMGTAVVWLTRWQMAPRPRRLAMVGIALLALSPAVRTLTSLPPVVVSWCFTFGGSLTAIGLALHERARPMRTLPSGAAGRCVLRDLSGARSAGVGRLVVSAAADFEGAAPAWLMLTLPTIELDTVRLCAAGIEALASAMFRGCWCRPSGSAPGTSPAPHIRRPTGAGSRWSARGAECPGGRAARRRRL